MRTDMAPYDSDDMTRNEERMRKIKEALEREKREQEQRDEAQNGNKNR